MDVQLGISKRSAFFHRIELSAWAMLGREEEGRKEGGRHRNGASAGPRKLDGQEGPRLLSQAALFPIRVPQI